MGPIVHVCFIWIQIQVAGKFHLKMNVVTTVQYLRKIWFSFSDWKVLVFIAIILNGANLYG